MRPRGNRIQVRFTWRGEQVSPTLNMKPTAANLKWAARLRATIEDEIRSGTFDIASHFPDYGGLSKYQSQDAEAARTFGDWVKVWSGVAARTLEHSTITIYERHLKSYWMPVFGDLPPARITHLKILEHLTALSKERVHPETGKVSKALSRKTQNNIMIPLRAVFELICKPPSRLANPTDGIENQRTQKPKPDPFSLEEVEVILSSLRKGHGEEFADYFEFSFFAGLRPSEQIALMWDDVDLRTGTIRVHRARVLTKDKDRTKTHVERFVELNQRALAALKRQRARTGMQGKEVFYNPSTGAAYVDEQSQRRAWRLALRSAGVRYRAPKECRDTSVTLALMLEANPMWVAQQHGHSMQVMLDSYAKWIPSGDGGSNVARINNGLGGKSKRSAASI